MSCPAIYLFIVLTCIGTYAESVHTFMAASKRQIGGSRNVGPPGPRIVSGKTGIESFSIEDVESYGFENERKERSVTGAAAMLHQMRRKGIFAMAFLLRDAQEMKNIGSITWFTKRGTWRRAISDFNSVKPKFKKEYFDSDGTYIMEGHIGDRSLLLTNNEIRKTVRLQVFREGYEDYMFDIIDYVD